MCGVFGVIGNYEKDKCDKAISTMLHRGPDGSGEFENDFAFIYHQRLSILDITSSGTQPMSTDNTVISVNGEIYNFQILKNELINLGCEFKSDSDSEVVLHGFETWGISKLLDKIDGMYAIVIFDMKGNDLYIARDRYGVKPLHYYVGDDYLAYSSEIKAIEELVGSESLVLDNTAIYDYLTYKYIPEPKTIYKNLYKLEAGTFAKFDRELNVELIKYWDVNPSENELIDEKIACQKIKDLIKESVEEQMISDVPLGAFLSGGIDSSVIVSEACLVNDKLKTFTIGFTDNQHDESHYAQKVSDEFSTEHHVQFVDNNAIADNWKYYKKWFDEPFGDHSAFPTYIISKYAREKVVVALSGDGGDELFAGYKWYKAFLKINDVSLNNSKINKRIFKTLNFLSFKKIKAFRERTRIFSLAGDDELSIYTELLGGLTKEKKSQYREKLSIPEDYDDYWFFRKYYREDLPIVKRLQYLDFKTYLPNQVLTKVDRTSMACSLECRVPFLKRELVEYTFSIPGEMHLKNGCAKYLLKEAYKNILPNDVLNRAKKGFGIPLGSMRTVAIENNGSFHVNVLNKFWKKIL